MAKGFNKDTIGYWIAKDPDANLDYQVSWASNEGSWLGADLIVAVQWLVDAGITQTAQAFTTTTATIWLAGGTIGTSYNVTCRITTATGRIDDRSFRVVVQAR